MNNDTNQFVSVTADGVRTLCSHRVPASCTDYLKISATQYSGNVQTAVSPGQFTLMSASGVRYAAASAKQASRVVEAGDLLPTTTLQPDDDGDYASGTLVFLVPAGPARFSLRWQGLHVATFVRTRKDKLRETR